jgi:hypothetical protein
LNFRVIDKPLGASTMPQTKTPSASADRTATETASQSGKDMPETECLASVYGSRIAAALWAEHGTSTDQATAQSEPH